jgi:hypothetical protein
MADSEADEKRYGALDRPDFSPGTMGCHEALHMASFLADAVDLQLCAHPSVLMNPEWRELADTAKKALADLYGKIGNAHL